MKTISLPLPMRLVQRVDFPSKLGICERLFASELAQYGIAWVNTAAGIAWKLDLTNRTHRWIVYGKYENPFFLKWAKRFLPSDGIIVDSGANIGQMLLYLAQWVSNGQVLAFEPGAEQAMWLQECLAIHTELPVEIIQCGLGASSSKKYLANFGDASIHGAWAAISEMEGEPIQIVRLEDELALRAIEKVDLWKLDVQYYELPALEGAKSLLQQQRIRAIWVELTGEQGSLVKDYLTSFGYQCYAFNKLGKIFIPSNLIGVHDGLFLPI